jgi:acetoin utilization deacetylase AcuC-like enzyme
MPAPVYFHHPSSLEHDTGGHPESTERIPAVEAELASRDWLGFERVRAPEVERDALLAVHTAGHVERIEEISERGGGAIDMDTVASAGSYHAALHSTGGAMAMVDRLLEDGGPDIGFCGLRPPGHHATRGRAMGFCLFNNVAVAARRALDAHQRDRVLVLDWDVHHGNGTEAIFAEEDRVLYASIHQSPLYPGTGPADEVGRDRGEGYTMNLPVPPGAGDEQFTSLVEHVVVPAARAWEVELILVSAGYDAHRDDALASCEVTEGGYATMAGSVRRLSADLGGTPVGLVLEGGYNLEALAGSVAATLEVLVEPAPPSDPGIEVDELAAEAAARGARYWPALSDIGEA